MKTNNTNKYYLYFEAYFSNWKIARFTDKNNFILTAPYKQTKNNLYFFTTFDKKNVICHNNDIEIIQSDFEKKFFNYNMKLFEVDRNTYLKAIELLKNHDETNEKETALKDFYIKLH